MAQIIANIIAFLIGYAIGTWLFQLLSRWWPEWESGRQGSGYFKLKLFESWRLKCDCWLLKYPKGSYINWHQDPTPVKWEHHRLNIVLKRTSGGHFQTAANSISGIGDHYPTTSYGRIVYFRPDITRHRVTEVLEGTRYVLSIGWLRRKR